MMASSGDHQSIIELIKPKCMNNRSKIIYFFSKWRSIFFSVALLVLLTSCLDDDDNLVTEPVEVAYVSIYHAAPETAPLDIVVDGRMINRNPFDYTSYSGYLNFFTGNRDILFQVADQNKTLIDTTFNLEDGNAYSLFAVNTPSGVEALLVTDSAAAPASGKAMVRFINLSPDAPAFDLAIGEEASALFEGKAFKEASAFQEIEADHYTFQVRYADSSDPAVTTESIEIRPGRFYTIVSRGFVNPPEGNDNSLGVDILD